MIRTIQGGSALHLFQPRLKILSLTAVNLYQSSLLAVLVLENDTVGLVVIFVTPAAFRVCSQLAPANLFHLPPQVGKNYASLPAWIPAREPCLSQLNNNKKCCHHSYFVAGATAGAENLATK